MSERFQVLAPMAKSYYGQLSLCADDEGLVVAVRTLALGAAAERSAVERIATRANRAVSQSHLHIVPLLEVHEEGEVRLVNQYMEGAPLSTLARMLMTRPAAPDRKVMARIIVDALSGLEFLAAHDHYNPGGMTPDAIMVCADGRTRLIEPTVQAAFGHIPALKRHQNRVSYRAPEQLSDSPSASEQADVFTMGVILWELLNKRRLFAGLGYDVIAKNIRTADVPLLKGDKALQLVLERALEREPQKRFETVSEMRTELKATAPHTDTGEVAKLFENVLGSHPSIQRMREVAAEHTVRQPSRRRVPPVRPLGTTPSGSFDVDNEPTSSGRPMDTFPPPIPTEEELDEPKRQIGRGELFAEVASDDATAVQMGRWLGAAGFARLITVTTLQEKYADEDAVVGALVEDARVISRVKHPNLVPIHDLIDDEDELFVVMDYLDGVSLAHALRQVKRREELFPIGIASRIVSGVLHGLHAAHEARGEDGEPAPVVHRNICPDAVMLGADGYARLVDFGLERGLERSAHSRKRKWSYKAPEQVREEDVDPRTDIYGASVLAYELFTGRRPYRGRGIRKKVLAGDPPKPTKLREALPPKLESFVLRGMSLDPDDRWEDAEEMAEAIDKLPGMASHRDVVEWLREVAGARLEHAQRLRRAVENAPVTLSADELEGPLSVSSAPRESLFDIEPPPEEPEAGVEAEVSEPDVVAGAVSEPPKKESKAPKKESEPPAERPSSAVEPLTAGAAAPARSSNTRTWLIAGAAAAVSAGMVALIMARDDGGETHQAAPVAPQPLPSTSTAASPVTPPPTTAVVAAGSSAPAISSTEAQPAPEPPPVSSTPAPWPTPKASSAWPPTKPEPPPEPTSTPSAPPTSSRRIPDDI